MLVSKGTHVPESLGEAASRRGMIRLPDAPRQVHKGRAHVFGSVPNAQPGMEEAQDQHGLGEERLPRRLGSAPTVGIDRLRTVVRLDIVRLCLEDTIGCL